MTPTNTTWSDAMKSLLAAVAFWACLFSQQACADNSIFTLTIYKHSGLWVFDDSERKLVKEPFVGKATDVLNHLTRAIPEAAQGVRLVFATGPFPGHMDRLSWKTQGEAGYGDFYHSSKFQDDIWLCPALLKYFPRAPEVLYYGVEALAK